MKNLRKGEVVTILTLATLVVIGLSTVISTLFLQSSKNKLSSNPRASVNQCKCINGVWNDACADEGIAPDTKCGDSLTDTSAPEPTEPPVPAQTAQPLPTPNAKGELLCPCSDAESCSGGHWCGNDCRIHTDNDYKCNAAYLTITPAPTKKPGLPSGADCDPRDYPPKGCDGFNLCGGDWKWRLNSPECSWKVPTPTSTKATSYPAKAANNCEFSSSLICKHECESNGQTCDKIAANCYQCVSKNNSPTPIPTIPTPGWIIPTNSPYDCSPELGSRPALGENQKAEWDADKCEWVIIVVPTPALPPCGGIKICERTTSDGSCNNPRYPDKCINRGIFNTTVACCDLPPPAASTATPSQKDYIVDDTNAIGHFLDKQVYTNSLVCDYSGPGLLGTVIGSLSNCKSPKVSDVPGTDKVKITVVKDNSKNQVICGWIGAPSIPKCIPL